jgi:hypothetical protein
MDWMCETSGTNNDRWLIEEVFPGKTDGCYIEIGLGSPKRESATWNLEQLGWRGMSFEPNPYLYRGCWSVRRNPVIYSAVWGEYVVGGMVDLVVPNSEPHRAGVRQARNDRQLANDAEKGFQVLSVPYIEFQYVLAICGERFGRLHVSQTKFNGDPITRFHFDAICIDCENAELQILQQFDPTRYSAGAWTIESSNPGQLRSMMRQYGYLEVENRFNTDVHHERYFLPE